MLHLQQQVSSCPWALANKTSLMMSHPPSQHRQWPQSPLDQRTRSDEPTSSDSNVSMTAVAPPDVWGIAEVMHPQQQQQQPLASDLHQLLAGHHHQQQQQQQHLWQADSSAVARARCQATAAGATTVELPSMEDLIADGFLQTIVDAAHDLELSVPALPAHWSAAAGPAGASDALPTATPNLKTPLPPPSLASVNFSAEQQQPNFLSHTLADAAAKHQRWQQQLQLAEAAAAIDGICGSLLPPSGLSSSSSDGAFQLQHALGSYQHFPAVQPGAAAAPAAAQPEAPDAARPKQQARKRRSKRASDNDKDYQCSSQGGCSAESGSDDDDDEPPARLAKRQRSSTGRARSGAAGGGGAAGGAGKEDVSIRNCLYQRARRQRQRQELDHLKQQVASLSAAKAQNQERIAELLASHTEMLSRMRELTSKWQATVELNQELQRANLEARQQISALQQRFGAAAAPGEAQGLGCLI